MNEQVPHKPLTPPAPRAAGELRASSPTSSNITPSSTSGQDTLKKLAHEAEHAVEQAKTGAIARVEDVRSRASAGLSEQQHALAGRIQRVGGILHQTSEQLRDDEPTVAHYVDLAGRRIESAAHYVSSTDAQRLARDVRDFASSRPAWFFGGAFIAGLALGRFLKSSGGHEFVTQPHFDDDQPGPGNVSVQRTSFVGQGRANPSYAQGRADASYAQGRSDPSYAQGRSNTPDNGRS